ncbi:4-pyridoxate dehydrogenase-like [Diorhabda carinulata]|uniref:4-pyridoxate dehydrogenase-like n=1 Tax=Diorhabda carinulata TaxID=1163345 RepID=UPI0025A06491|nr:4-pyridoxate dehydrogenase-like [Diorhabda carinulata]
MKYHLLFIVFFSGIISIRTLELDELYNFVTKELDKIQNYQLPKNNEKLFRTSDSKIHDYGKYDFIIVGAGAAGAVLANRLSEVANWEVLLLEAGGETNDFSDIPAYDNLLQRTDMNWGYYSTPQTTCCQGMVNHQCVCPRGKVIGGSTTLNGAIYSRGSPSDYDDWAYMGNTEWSYEKILPYFKKSEHVAFKPYDKYYHGENGLVYVNYTYPESVIANTFLRANIEKGLKEIDYNGREQLGVSRIQFTIKDSKHQNSEHSFLDGVKQRKNLKIELNAAVNKIWLKKDVAESVTFIKNGIIYKAEANKEIILAAGAINTPQLLILSGVGPKSELAQLGIEVIRDLPAVGRNLQDHPMFLNVFFRTNVSAPQHTVKENLELYLQGKTPLTNVAGLESIAFFNSKTITSGKPDIELLTILPPLSVPSDIRFSFNLQEEASKIYNKYNTLTDFQIAMILLKPKSRGKVTLKSNSIIDFPLIDFNYFSDEEDLKIMRYGIKYVLSLQNTRAFKSVNATFISEYPNCEHLKDDEDKYWNCAFRHMTSTLYHPSCTTRMGQTITDSVVNQDCLVHTFQNLRVVDAGVLPDIIRGHPMSTIYMIAEKISDSIKKKFGKLVP